LRERWFICGILDEIGRRKLMTQRTTVAMLVLIAGLLATHTSTHAQNAKTGVLPVAELSWKGVGVPGVATAVVNGDTSKGPSHFYLKYNRGFVAPVHYHSPDHFVTTVTGTLVLIVDGKEHRLAPGSFFALINKAKHAARCEGSEDCVMFIDARGPWDVVVDK
jgi:mannose-6-phosphate isomerase-like protein (cupin superfamily)